jgi:hypothetical protein
MNRDQDPLLAYSNQKVQGVVFRSGCPDFHTEISKDRKCLCFNVCHGEAVCAAQRNAEIHGLDVGVGIAGAGQALQSSNRGGTKTTSNAFQPGLTNGDIVSL